MRIRFRIERFLDWLFVPTVEDHMRAWRKLSKVPTWKLIGKKRARELLRGWERDADGLKKVRYGKNP